MPELGRAGLYVAHLASMRFYKTRARNPSAFNLSHDIALVRQCAAQRLMANRSSLRPGGRTRKGANSGQEREGTGFAGQVTECCRSDGQGPPRPAGVASPARALPPLPAEPAWQGVPRAARREHQT